MRGQQTFQSLFSENLPFAQKQEGKGRCADLNAKRDELIISRFYFYTVHTPYRYDLILQSLSDEFFLSIRRIQDVISINSNLMRAVRKEQPSVKYLREKYPHLVWQPIASPKPKKVVMEL